MFDTEENLAYQSAQERAACFDLSAYGKIALAGPDALTFLHNLSTNDVKGLPVGGGCEAFLCNARARTLAYLLVSRRQDQPPNAPFLLLDMVPGLNEKVMQHLNKYLISEQVEIIDQTQDLALVRLVGPRATDVLQELFGASLPDTPSLASILKESPLAGPCHIRPHTLLGQPGFDIFCARDRLAVLLDKLSSLAVQPGSAEVHEVLRIEAGTPEYGKDMDEDRFVAEVGRTTQAICYTKGCYLGQEPIVMARDRGQVNRTLMGVKFVVGTAPLPPGCKLFAADAEIGQITSSVWSPRFQQVLALAYVRRGHQQPGSEVLSEGRRGELGALPFVLS